MSYTHRRAALLSWILVLLFAPNLSAGNTRITVSSGGQQTYMGSGASNVLGPEFCDEPEALRDTLARLFWVEGNMNNLRLWSWCGISAEEWYNYHRCFVEDALKYRPDVIIYLGPNGHTGLLGNDFCPLEDRVEATVDQIAYCVDKGWPIAATGMTNEPNVQGKASPAQIVSLLKSMRGALDAKGLNDIKLIAPEVCCVNAGAFGYMQAIIGDKAALDICDAFSTHSYTDCTTKALRDLLWPHKKEFWMSESSTNGPEQPGNDQAAARQAGALLSDMNLLATHWTHFIAYGPSVEDDDMTHIFAYHDISDLGILLKYYYYKQINHTITPGSVVRLSNSSAEGWMENKYGTQPAVCAAAAVNPDGTWGLVAVNKTNTGYDQWGYHSQPDATWDVTFHVEELADEGDIEFNVLRSSKSAQMVEEGPLTMRNGDISVNLPPRHLVSLRNGEFSSGATAIAGRPRNAAPLGSKTPAVAEWAIDGAGIRITMESPGCSSLSAAIYNLRGTRIVDLPEGEYGSGRHTMNVALPASRPFPSGVYLVRVQAGGANAGSFRFAVRR